MPPIATLTVAPVPNESPATVMSRLPDVGPEAGRTLVIVGGLYPNGPYEACELKTKIESKTQSIGIKDERAMIIREYIPIALRQLL